MCHAFRMFYQSQNRHFWHLDVSSHSDSYPNNLSSNQLLEIIYMASNSSGLSTHIVINGEGSRHVTVKIKFVSCIGHAPRCM
jgi:hypothetical protein